MADELDDEEAELLRKHREKKAAKQRSGRKVTVRGKHDSGAEYSFDLDGDEADRIVSRHRALWEDEDEDEAEGQADGGEGEEDGDGEGGTEGGQAKPRPRGKPAAGSAPPAPAAERRAPYFKR